ncbi:hypothetical protein HID58_049329, partial [Brassica napus]
MTRRRHKDKEILGTVPPACCMELPYFHGKAAALGDIIGCYRCIWLAWFWDNGVASWSAFSFDKKIPCFCQEKACM